MLHHNLEKYEENNRRVKELITFYENLIGDQFILFDCIENNETLVGLETLCLELDSPDITLPVEVYQKLIDACKFLGVSPDYWQDILHE
jgi:hypothetical protein